jgi:hypothetical protein
MRLTRSPRENRDHGELQFCRRRRLSYRLANAADDAHCSQHAGLALILMAHLTTAIDTSEKMSSDPGNSIRHDINLECN